MSTPWLCFCTKFRFIIPLDKIFMWSKKVLKKVIILIERAFIKQFKYHLFFFSYELEKFLYGF